MPDPIALQASLPFFLAAFIGGYLLGSVPFGLVLARLGGYGDIRKIGSGNIGATNVLRTGNKPLAAATLLLDSGKGAVAVLIGLFYGPYIALFAGMGALLGHLYPVWLRFQGGKGVATTLGTLIAYSWPVGLAACASWLLTAALFRISSLAALVALALSPVFAFLIHGWLDMPPQTPLPVRFDHPAIVLTAFAALLVWWRHRANIARLVSGTEPKIGQGKQKGSAAS